MNEERTGLYNTIRINAWNINCLLSFYNYKNIKSRNDFETFIFFNEFPPFTSNVMMTFNRPKATRLFVMLYLEHSKVLSTIEFCLT